MASTPSFAPTRSEVKYDAYLSFSKDTRNNFSSHLLAALCRAKIETFTHDALIEKVYEIPSSVLRAIEESRVYIIIFSKGYASSAWCLDELVKIIDCKKRYSQIVIPVFYQVDPWDVRSQSGVFEDVFAKHEEVYKKRLDNVQRWRDALTEASILDGWLINDDRPEARPVEEIVKHVLERLDDFYPSDDKNLIGVQSSIENIESLLRIGSRDVCIIGIWGMGGIGKTAIARAVFDRIFRQFEGYYFAENVWLESEKDGLIHLGKELLSTILEDEHLNLRSAFTKQRFQRKKVLIVLDDVTSIEQIEKLIGDFKYLALGARVIITSRNRQVLKQCVVDDANIFEVQRLCDDDALQLFRRFAFGQNRSTADCMEVSSEVVTYAQGVPLALKVLGSFLFGKKKQDWEREINKLENCPHEDIQKVIRRSYDGLHDEEKNIFLDIACFFNRWDKYLVEEILDASYFSSNIGISTLIDKALITIFHNTITMNGLLQAMGKRIVQEQSMKDPSKRSRLWHPDDVYLVLTNNKGSEVIEGICLDMSKIREMHLKSCAFSNMNKLRVFYVYNPECPENNTNKVHGFEGLEFDFKELRYLGWHGYPSKSLPQNFCPQNLIALEMPHSNLEQVSIGIQNLHNLKYIDLGNSRHLVKSLYLSLIPNLRSINLNNCGITELPYSLDQLSSLEYLYLARNNFESIPLSIINLTKLIMLHVSYCKRLISLPKLPCHLEHLEAQSCISLQKLSGLPNLKPSLRTKIFSFINCFRLDQNTLKGIAKDILLNFQQNTTVWFDVGQRYNGSPRGFICFPGGEIPECFKFQSTKSSIELPQGSLNNHLVGLAFCTVLSFKDYTRDWITVCCELLLKGKNGSHKEVSSGFVWVWDDVTAPDNVESDHILLGYDYYMYKPEFRNFSYNSEGIINFYVSNNDRIPSKHCKVKKCGVYLFYTQDAENPMADSSGRFISDEKRKGPLHRSRKRSESWTVDRPTLIDDGYAWKKYGQRVILMAKYPRNYYRCIHKHDEGCQATKQVQRIEENPPLYRSTYYGHHTCNQSSLSSSDYLLSPDLSNHEVNYDERWTVDSPKIIDDGHGWRKYGQKEIPNAKYPRGYYHCIHRNVEGCRAVKQVQRIQETPPLFTTTYCRHHTCSQSSSPNYLLSPDLSNREVNYDVFLSFRGEDTHDSFTSHLHAALCRAKIETFIDNEDDELSKADEISSYLLNAIEESMISVIIFSKGYASSKWCLGELVRILECKKSYGQVVMPVFYHVDPSDVRTQTGTFGYAFAELEKISKENQVWRTALREAASLPGFDSNVIWPEAVLVEEIVKHILKKLNDLYPSDNKNLVGVQSSIKKIESSLQISSKDVCTVGIWGMGGIGKTTITRAVFNKICHQFENCYFAENVSEESEKDGLISMQKEFLSTILKDELPNEGFTFTKERLQRKRVLIVFDNVSSLEQIMFLIGDPHCLGMGTRVIITTRDRQVLTNCGVDDNNVYKVEALFHHEALQLFSWYAFQQNRPTLGYNEVSNRVLKYAKGVPLALKVLGSFLLGKTKGVWEIVINKLESVPHEDIKMLLKLSYDGLDEIEKNIFLDIACFLVLENKDFAMKFLDVSGFFAEIGISSLLDKCLISISNDKIQMHNLLQEMGREIVQEESFKEPGKRSRLWYHADICHVLRHNTGTKAIEGICLDMSKTTNIHLHPRALAEMHNLRFLKVFNSHCEENYINKVHVSSQGLESFFTELRYLCWHGCPLKSLQSNCFSKNLVALDMPHSKVEQLWPGAQDLYYLKSINLSHSKHLLKSPDLSRAPNLVSLILEDCRSLTEICSSVRFLNNLVSLNLRHCKSLCFLPMISCNVEELSLDETAIEELLIENLSRLIKLDLKNCSRLKTLPSCIAKLTSLEYLDISGCLNLDRLPHNLENLEALKVLKAEGLDKIVLLSILCLRFLIELNLVECCIMELPSSLGQLSSLEGLLLGRNNFESIPKSIIDLCKLSYLELGYCKRLQFLPELPYHLQCIDAQGCTSLTGSSDLSILFPTISRNARVNLINCFSLDPNALIDIVKMLYRKFGIQ